MVGSAKSQFNVPDEKWILPEFENWTNDTDLSDKIYQRNSTEHLSIFFSAISIPICDLNFEPITKTKRTRRSPIRNNTHRDRSQIIAVSTFLGMVRKKATNIVYILKENMRYLESVAKKQDIFIY